MPVIFSDMVPIYFWYQLFYIKDNWTVLTCLWNPMDGGAWCATLHGVAKSLTRLSDFTFTFHFHALEKEMATHSTVLAWSIPGTGEPDGLPSMGSHRVGHDWCDLAAAAATCLVNLWDPHHRPHPGSATCNLHVGAENFDPVCSTSTSKTFTGRTSPPNTWL